MKNFNKTVFIFGAGASRSINEKVPLMNDFFEKAADYLQDPIKYPAFWLSFIMVERYRLFQSTNAYLENLAMFILDSHWYMLELSRSNAGQPKKIDTEGYKKIEKCWRRWIELYYEGIKKDSSRLKSNLEDVFGRAEKLLYKEEKEDPFVRLLFAINSLFYELRKDFPYPDLHNKLSDIFKRWLEQNPKNKLSIISFNYDLWLERAMQKYGIWSPRNGYGVTFDKFIDISIARNGYEEEEKVIRNGAGMMSALQTNDIEKGESRTVILKPNGSLSWLYNKEHNRYLLLLDKEEKDVVIDNEGRWYIRNIEGESKSNLETYESLLIPPTPLKRRTHSIFWKIDKRVEEELSSADSVVIIGWSMPETDKEHIQKIKHIIEHRSEQIQNLVVCDIRKDNSLYVNFEAVFKPAIPIRVYSSGFSDEFLLELESMLI